MVPQEEYKLALEVITGTLFVYCFLNGIFIKPVYVSTCSKCCKISTVFLTDT